jgi:hypothetical protein
MALAVPPATAAAQPNPRQKPDGREVPSVASFGARGNGVAYGSKARRPLDAAFAANAPDFLPIPPGTYTVAKSLPRRRPRTRRATSAGDMA